MKLGIDARLYFQTGVGVYIRNLLFNLSKLFPKDWQIYVYFLLEDKEKINFPKNYIPRFVRGHWHSFLEQTLFLKEVLKDNLDLIHFTYFSYPLLYPKDFVITIHDLTPLKFKTGKASTKGSLIYEVKHFFYKSVLYSAILRARKIIVPSKKVKKDLENIGADAQKIKIIYEGVDKDLIFTKEERVEVNGPFFLYIGNFYPHKNVEFAINLFLETEFKEKFLLVGPDDFFAKKLKESFKNIINKKIVFLHNLKRSQIKFLYKRAKALIHPSLSEGFGLTVLEALYFNCPVIASDIEVFRELYGESLFYFNPKDKNDLKLTILKALKLKNKKEWQTKIDNVVKKFNFIKTARQTLRLYKSFS